MSTAFSQQMIVERETNIELFQDIQSFIDKMEEHIEKYPNYSYAVELMGGKPGFFQARVILTRHGNNEEIKTVEGDSESYGVL